jgi:hypothetical protein
MSETTPGRSQENAMRDLVKGASEECKAVVGRVLQLERDHLLQENPNKSRLGREIAMIVREVVK